jgi:hypothetical protein
MRKLRPALKTMNPNKRIKLLQTQLELAVITLDSWRQFKRPRDFDELQNLVGRANCIVNEMRNDLRGIEPPKIG